jgi:hypothetical protein
MFMSYFLNDPTATFGLLAMIAVIAKMAVQGQRASLYSILLSGKYQGNGKTVFAMNFPVHEIRAGTGTRLPVDRDRIVIVTALDDVGVGSGLLDTPGQS